MALQSPGCHGRRRHSGGYSLPEGWYRPYPETTGYIIPTFLAYAAYSKDPSYIDRAVRMGRWELGIQLSWGLAGRNGQRRAAAGFRYRPGDFWIDGALPCHRGRPRFLEAFCRRAADWVIQTQDPDGNWTKYALHGIPHAYYAMVELAS